MILENQNIAMKQIAILFFFLWLSFASFGQSRKALSLYKNQRYSEAIPYLLKTIEKDSGTKYKIKLADCYRRTNQLEHAAKLYAQIVKRKHFSKKTFIYYGETLMGLGQYDEAKSWFLKYSELNPKDNLGTLKAEACDYVKTIKPYFSNVIFEDIPFNSNADDSNPTIYKDKIYFSSDRKSGFNPLKKKSGWTGRDLMKIFAVDILDSTFTDAKPISNRINNLNKNTGKPSFSDNGDCYFTRNSSISKGGTYKLHIFHSKLTGTKWNKPEELSFCQVSINYLHPAVSHDGKTLIFASNRSGGEGGMDLFVSTRHGSRWTRPSNLGPVINTKGHEGFPYIHPSGRLFFSSKGHKGFGGFDIFVSEQDIRGNWSTPINLGQPINSSKDDIGFFLDNKMQKALFSSNRKGDNDDIFMCQVDTTHTVDSDSIDLAIDSDSIDLAIDSGFVEKYLDAFTINDIKLLAGDTIYLVAPDYAEDKYDVPEYLSQQLDLLVPAMYFSTDLKFEILCFTDESSSAIPPSVIIKKRANGIKKYLESKHIPEKQLTASGLSLSKSKNNVTFANKKNIIILVTPKLELNHKS